MRRCVRRDRGAWVSRSAGRTKLTSGILTALVTATAGAVFVPKLVFLGELRWGYRQVDPTAYPRLFGLAGNMTPGKAVAAALVLLAACGAISRVTARNGPSGTGPAPAAGSDGHPQPGPALALRSWAGTLPRLAVMLGFTAMLIGLALAGYYYFTRGYPLA
jgi:hypothetical protein